MTMRKDFEQFVEAYKSAEDDEKTKIYVEHLLSTIVEHALGKWQEMEGESTYDHLITSVGLSPEPVILMITVLRPKEVSFLVTAESRRKLDVIVESTGLRPSRWNSYPVDSSTMVEVYQVIRDIHNATGERRIAMDITGGKKLMSAGAALAAAQAGIDILYVDYLEYDPTGRRPITGTEYVARLEDPMVVFGERELDEIKRKCERHDYAGAIDAIVSVRSRVPEPQVFEIYQEVALAYKLWEDFDFKKARSHLVKAVTLMEAYRQLPALKDKIREQASLLAPLEELDRQSAYETISKPDLAWLLIGSCLTNGRRREEQSRLDMASLLMYRTLEMTIQRRLACFGIDAKEPDYAQLGITTEELFAKFKAAFVEAIGSYRGASLPHPIGLMQGAVLLRVLEDPSLQGINPKDLWSNVDQRNQSILAHGIKRIERRNYERLAKMAYTIAHQAWELEEEAAFALGFTEFLDRLTFACLD